MPNVPDLDRIIALTEAERGYIAGFFDGEGSVILTTSMHGRMQKKYPRLVVTIAQKRGDILVWLYELFGGSLFNRKRNDRGFSQRDGEIDVWSIVSRDSVQLFYRVVKPYLRLKKAEFVLAIEAINNPNLTIEEVNEVAENMRTLRVVGE